MRSCSAELSRVSTAQPTDGLSRWYTELQPSLRHCSLFASYYFLRTQVTLQPFGSQLVYSEISSLILKHNSIRSTSGGRNGNLSLQSPIAHRRLGDWLSDFRWQALNRCAYTDLLCGAESNIPLGQHYTLEILHESLSNWQWWSGTRAGLED